MTERINSIAVDKNFFEEVGKTYIDIAKAQIKETGRDVTDQEVSALAQELKELNGARKLNEGDEIFIPLEYAVEEMQANVDTASNNVTAEQSNVSNAQSALNEASGAVADALSEYNSVRSKEKPSQEEISNAKAAYDAAIKREAQAKKDLEAAQKKLGEANQAVTKANQELNTAKQELKEEQDLSKKEKENIEKEINRVQGELQQAQQKAQSEQKQLKAEVDSSKEASEQNQKIATNLGDDPSKLEIKNALNNTVSSIKYISSFDGAKKQVIKYADGTSAENNQHEGKAENKNSYIYYGNCEKDENGNIVRDNEGKVKKQRYKNGLIKPEMRLDSDGHPLYNGDSEYYQGMKISDIPTPYSKPSDDETKLQRAMAYPKDSDGKYLYNTKGFGVQADNDDAVVEQRVNENGEYELHVMNAKGLVIATDIEDDIRIVVEDSEVYKISSEGNNCNNKIEVHNSTVKKDPKYNKGYIGSSSIESGNIIIKNTKFEEGTEINTYHGNDNIEIYNSDVYSIHTSDGVDSVVIKNSKAQRIETNADPDTIILKNSTTKEIDGGDDEDGLVVDKKSSADSIEGIEIQSTETEETKNDDKGKEEPKTDNKVKAASSDVKSEPSANVKEIMKKYNVSEEEAEKIADDNMEEAEISGNAVAEKYFGKGSVVSSEKQIQAACLNELEMNAEALKAQLEGQDKDDGWVAQGYNGIKELINAGVSRSDIEDAISKQEEVNEELKKALLGESDKYKTFEEAYEALTGVEYDQDKVADYMETYSKYQLATTGLNKLAPMEEKLQDAENMQEVLDLFLDQYNGDSGMAVREINKYLNQGEAGKWYDSDIYEVKVVEEHDDHGNLTGYKLAARTKNFKDSNPLNGDATQKTSTGHGDFVEYSTTNLTGESNLFKHCKNDKGKHPFTSGFADRYEEMMGESIEDVQKDLSEKQLSVFGKTTAAARILDQYRDDQNSIEKRVSEALSKAGMVITAAGAVTSLFCPPAGATIMKVGGATMKVGMFADETLEAIDNITSENRSLDTLTNCGKDFVTDFALYWSGRGIGKLSGAVGNMAGGAVSNLTNNAIVQGVAKYGTEAVIDGSMSMAADMLITGNTSLEAEGFNQLMGIWTGIAQSKIENYSNNVINNSFKEYAGNPNAMVAEMKLQGFTKKQIKEICDNTYGKDFFTKKQIAAIDAESFFDDPSHTASFDITKLPKAVQNIKYEDISKTTKELKQQYAHRTSEENLRQQTLKRNMTFFQILNKQGDPFTVEELQSTLVKITEANPGIGIDFSKEKYNIAEELKNTPGVTIKDNKIIIEDRTEFENCKTDTQTSLLNHIDELKKINSDIVANETILFKYRQEMRYQSASEMVKNIKDPVIVEYLEKVTDFNEFTDIVDAVNSANGNYTALRYDSNYNKYAPYGEASSYGKLDDYLKTQGTSVYEIIKTGKIPDSVACQLQVKGISKNDFIEDIKSNIKYASLERYCQNRPNTELSNYLYENYYLKNVSGDTGIKKEALEYCKNINDKYGTKIFVSSYNKESNKTLKFIESEFEAWKKAGGDNVKYPATLDYTLANPEYYDKESAYGNSVAAGYQYGNSIWLSAFSEQKTKQALRHEMTHANDLALHKKQAYAVSQNEISDIINNKKYRDEFRKAGIPDYHIDYAYNNPAEFIAVASEGDISKYSDEFKQILLAFGMPSWELGLV